MYILLPSILQVYAGKCKLTDKVDGVPLDAGKLVLSPTRTYAPIIKKILDSLRSKINGIVHCSGGAQTKVWQPGSGMWNDSMLLG